MVGYNTLSWSWFLFVQQMMTSSNENVFRITGPLRGESTGDRWIPGHQ